MASPRYLTANERNATERTVRDARELAETGARAAIEQLAVSEPEAPPYLDDAQRALRRRLRARARQLGDPRRSNGAQEVERLVSESAYVHWHRMLFARFLAEHHLLMWEGGVPVTLEECDELAQDASLNLHCATGWEVAGRLTVAMLPQLFSVDSPVLALIFAPEHQRALERSLSVLPQPVFSAADSLGWIYQYWQAKRKEEVNATTTKIGPDELPPVTQLFTEDYMVDDLLDSTLGRLSAERQCSARLIDPCCGSGHFLLNAFYRLVRQRIETQGLSPRDAIDAVLRENLFGLEIDDRCVEIAVFALALAAWTYRDEDGEVVGYRPLPRINVACSGRAPLTYETSGQLPEALRSRALNAGLIGSLALSGLSAAEIEGLLSHARTASSNKEPDDAEQLQVAALGYREANDLMSQTYDLVVTNPPFLGRGRMCDALRAFVETQFYAARHDLGAGFVRFCLTLARPEARIGLVIQQSWLFAGSYKDFRAEVLELSTLERVANLGEGAFRSAGAAGAFPSLLTLRCAAPTDDSEFLLLDVSDCESVDARREALSTASRAVGTYESLRASGDYLVAAGGMTDVPLLSEYATAYVGLQTSDYPRYCRMFWELPNVEGDWSLMQEAPDKGDYVSGLCSVFYWQEGKGELATSDTAYIRGQAAWGLEGVMVSRMRQLEVALYAGDFFNQTCAAVIPHDIEHLPAIFAYCASDHFTQAVRDVDKRICVANSALTRVPFDLEHWTQAAQDLFPDGLPRAYSDDPTQWVFHGHPMPARHALQVAVMRLVGYQWPAEQAHAPSTSNVEVLTSSLARLTPFSDDDGIVCLASLRGEPDAADRLLRLLIEAWETVEKGSWKGTTLQTLLSAAGAGGRDLSGWLRDLFFEQHCKAFGNRPVVWHVWDGLRDGFGALVNCHKLDIKNLERLIHTYLGDWIRQQETGIRDGADGAPIRLAAAQDLKRRLELILEGEAPYDIFVRWKSLPEQPVGWNPDLNDGIRLNIRPFMAAEVLRHNKKPKLNITLDKDRGKDAESAPWFKGFRGERVNDYHLTLAAKLVARRQPSRSISMSEQKPAEPDTLAIKAAANLRRVSLRSLYLDPNNFRIIHEPDQKQVPDIDVKNRDVMQRTMRLLCGDKNQNIQDLIESFKANGYLRVDQILVRELPGDGLLVIEGNRRVAALKFLQNEYESKGIDLGQLSPDTFSQVNVVLYTDTDEVHHLTLMALKHISGNKKWGEWNQAQLLESMHNTHGLGEEEICRRIGISKVELRRSLRALSMVAEYQASDYGDQFNEAMFPIFRHAVRSAALKDWLSWDDGDRQIHDRANRDFFFSLLSREPMEEQEDDGSVGYGGKYLEPVITRRDDVDTLAKVITDERALDYLRKNRDLNGAYRSSDLVFRERQEAAVRSVAADIDTLAQLTINPLNLPELEGVRGKLQSIIDRARASGLSGVEQKAVFRDRVDAHFTQIHIKRYRRLSGLHMTQLARINLVAGINNSGKTSLLEAIYLLARQNDLEGLLEVMRRRGKVATDQLDPEWMLEQLGSDTLDIDGTFDQLPASVEIKQRIEEDSSIDRTRYLGSVEIESQFGATKLTSVNRIYKGQERETHADSLRLLCPVIFSSPFFFNEPHRYTGFYHKSVQSKALPDIFKFLREKMLPTLEDIRLTDERQRFLVVDSQFESGVDLSCYGEGLQRMFLLSLLFASAQHGVVLIDEFENALHYRLIEPFSRFVLELAQKFNVQVFITSHSKECIDAFITAVPEPKDMSCHAIVNTPEGIRTRDFSGPAFKRLLEAGNVDLRGAE